MTLNLFYLGKQDWVETL